VVESSSGLDKEFHADAAEESETGEEEIESNAATNPRMKCKQDIVARA
jgi:hypothetical protein